MWPVGHLAVGYFCYVAVVAWTDRSLPANWRSLAVLAFATQLPDLIDKPLGYAGILPSGRSLAHSLVVVFVATAGVRLAVSIARARQDLHLSRSILAAYRLPLLVGYLSHLVADSYGALLAGGVWRIRYLAWPLLPAIEYGSDGVAPWNRLLAMTLTPQIQAELLLAAAAIVVFVALRLRKQ
ncbi:metal-dependent hydrolase [Halorarum halophilum]|uniref:Metal-dependent hydrolase n=1 Tax=Halorarum halophilum TaxID=2743090 RepID=A0A7D5KWY9_9EURY|nr:metal-dependent hydrolase [Halobaculum halophilum]QLG27438.1 metal-dependent hydrolase [Halobaculum halophilum]